MPNNRFNFSLLAKAIALTAGVLTLAACGDDDDKKASTPAAATSNDANTVTVGNGAEPESLDLHKSSDGASFNIMRQMFEGLVASDAEGKTIPGLAERWENKDEKVWTFHLRDAKWSNGEPITAHDFVFALRRLTDPSTGSPYGSYLVDAKVINAAEIANGKAKADALGVKAIDDKTLEITLAEPVPYLPELFLLPVTYAVPKKVVEQHGDKWVAPENIVVSGAYKLAEWVVNGHIKLVRNPAYYDNGKTSIDNVMILPISGIAELNRFKAGEMDVTAGVPLEQFQTLKTEMASQMQIAPRLCTSYLEFNNTKAPFNDAKVRQAISLLLDRDTLALKVAGRGEKPTYQFTPTTTQGMVEVKPEWASWDQAKRVAEATKLLNEAGYNDANPLKFEFLYNTSESAKRMVTATSSLFSSSVKFVQPQPLNQEWKTSLETRRSGNYQVAYAAWCADYNEPSTFLTVFKSGNGNNSGKFNSKQYDDVLNKTLLAGVTPEQRIELYRQAEQILQQDAAAAFIMNSVSVNLVNEDLKGYSNKDPMSNWRVKDWSFKD